MNKKVRREERRQMGSRKLVLLIMFFTFLHMFELSSPLHKPSHSAESLQGIQPSNKEMDKRQYGITDVNSHNYGRNGVVHGSKFGRGGVAGTSGGKSTGSSENRNTDAGGAASNHHPNTHHGTSSSNQNCIGLLTLISTALASLACTFVH